MGPDLLHHHHARERDREPHSQPYAAHLGPRTDLDRWLGTEKEPADLLRSYPSADMRMWPISTRVNSPNNDDPSILKQATKHTSPLRRKRA